MHLALCVAKAVSFEAMPRPKLSEAEKIRKWTSKYKKEFSTDGKILYCKLCEKNVTFERSTQVYQHRRTLEHSSKLSDVCQSETHQRLLVELSSSSEEDTDAGTSNDISRKEFCEDVCSFFVDNDIPLVKLNSLPTKRFFQKWVKRKAPAEATIRKWYVKPSYDRTIEQIRAELRDRKIWVSVDETTDKAGRSVGCVVVGGLGRHSGGRSFMLHLEQLQKVDHSAIAQLVQRALSILWPNGVRYDDVWLLVTDAAAYMKKAGKGLAVVFPNLLHLTCLAHALHNVAEQVRSQYPGVNDLIATVKSVFVKAPLRVQAFRTAAPDLSLPPEPVVTRWGTWLSAVSYYATNWTLVKSVIEQLKSDDAASIRRAKELFQDNGLLRDLAFIHANFAHIAQAITRLETAGLPLTDSLSIVRNVQERVQATHGGAAAAVQEKLRAVFAKNSGLATLQAASKVLSGLALTDGEKDLVSKYSPTDFELLQYVPVTSTDVERTFSRYKALLRDNRQNLTVQHVCWHLVSQCFTTQMISV